MPTLRPFSVVSGGFCCASLQNALGPPPLSGFSITSPFADSTVTSRSFNAILSPGFRTFRFPDDCRVGAPERPSGGSLASMESP